MAWHVPSGECKATFEGHRYIFGAITCMGSLGHPSGAWALLMVSYVTEIGSGSVRSVTWSPDGKMLSSGSFDETIELWSAETGQCLKTLAGHE